MPTADPSKASMAGEKAGMLSGVRDTVRLKLHLLSAEARDRWAGIESRLDHLQRSPELSAEDAGKGVASKVRDIGHAAENLLQEMHVPSELQLPASELMSRPRTCAPGANLKEAARIMWETDCGSVPVTEDGRLVGIITDRDICMTVHLRGEATAHIRVQDAMSREVHTCSATDSLHDVLRVMRRHRVRRVPIVEEDVVVGIISLGDISRHVQAQAKWGSSGVIRVERTLAAISMPRNGARTS